MSLSAPSPRKILMVANFQRKSDVETYYRTTFHIQHGLIRAGHFVITFSDRDAAREASLFGSQKTGRGKMVERLMATARHIRPDLVFFGHADMLTAADFARLRDAVPGVRLAQMNVDPTSRPAVMARFGERAASMDLSFITSGGLSDIAKAALPPRHRVHFMPNPVDRACEQGRTFEIPRERLARDGAFLGSKAVDRPAQLAAIADGLPVAFRWEVHGDVVDGRRINGAAFYDFLCDTALSPALQVDSAIAEQPLYASNRVAQQLGNGVLTLVHESAQMDRLFEDGIATFRDVPELIETMARLWRDDAERRRIAERGWRLAHERVAAARVGAYLVALCFDETPPAGLEWPSDPIS